MNTSESLLLSVLGQHRAGQHLGLFSVCCAHDAVLHAALAHAHAHGYPLLIEATSNQVDQFGGYTGMQPRDFHAHVHMLAARQGLNPRQLILGGDHLGPNAWQHLDAATAMAHARVLVAAYVQAGFEKIHLDCSMRCADDPDRLSDEVAAQRAADLCAAAEAARAQAPRGAPAPVYVIGTEVPPPGGERGATAAPLQVTTPEAARRTVAQHELAFARLGLQGVWPRVVALVVQPGVDFDPSHVHHYQAQAAKPLAQLVEPSLATLGGWGHLLYEAHSTDYQTEAALQALVRDHFAVLKVGPALTFAWREALFALAAIENTLRAGQSTSRLVEVLEACMLREPRHWQSHYGSCPQQQYMLRHYAYSDRCRYYWGQPELQAAQATLMAHLEHCDLPLPLLSQHLPAQYEAVMQGQLAPRANVLLTHHIQRVLDRYARACGLMTASGLDSRLSTFDAQAATS
ncbi:D-tagatose-bisphosphate aldolase, class II, non-catalytic subunit [Roseateles sp. BYS180W]|uniref:D-tagatose-bisphosphate aldolase, class II, non-catalytic subunit n=1 Tax=Roseateles rivi TaxID=3299028 RepID=A0ABW7FV19_9BURK